jgi:hypothetical protein
VLLTRSRLCPGPKPGSSLHLHVLGTPPAFVLSQDQTLREELHKESSGMMIVVDGAEQCRRRRRSSPGSIPGGMRPLRLLHCRSEYTSGAAAQDGVNLGTVDSGSPEGLQVSTASNLDTQFSIDESIEECACC